MIKKLLNPFIHIAGIKSLIFGILILLLTSIIGYFSNMHFPDIISIKIILKKIKYNLQYIYLYIIISKKELRNGKKITNILSGL